MKDKLLIKLGDFITKYRYLFFLLFLILFIIGVININNVKVNESLTDYLPSNTETKEGLKVMEKEFGTLSSINVMIKDVSAEDANSYYEKIKSINNVDIVMYKNNDSYYKDNNALYKIELVNKSKEEAHEVANDIKDEIKDKEVYIYSDKFEDPTEGVTLVLILSIFVIVAILLITAKTYFEPVIAFIIFLISIVLNMGSNFIFSEISYITKAIAVVLQLALSIDYVIIFMNQYMKEISDTDDKLLAIKKTISKSTSEIVASSLTTIAGLIALVFMQLKIGGDIGIVLSKGILCSLLTVILIMPILLDVFKNQIIKFKKKSKRKTNGALASLTNFIIKYKKVLLPIYVVLIIISIICIPKYNYVYAIDSIDSINLSSNVKSLKKQQEVFGKDNPLIILVKNEDKDFNKELEFTNKLKSIDGVKNAVSAGSYEISNNVYLGSKINYQQASIMFNMDKNKAKELFMVYALSNNELDSAKKIDSYGVSIANLFNFALKNIGSLSVDSNTIVTVSKLMKSYSFLESNNYSRIVLELNSDTESDYTNEVIDSIRKETNNYYSDSLLVGSSINANDLKDTFTNDNLIITFVTIIFIAIILLFTFKSIWMALLLILTIEGSILVNFAIVSLLGLKIFFMSYIVVSAIQMGATIDYAIVVANRYQQLRLKKGKDESLKITLHDRLSAIITSGLILLTAGFLVGTITTSSVISSIGFFLGLGTLISLLATMLFLPAILYTFDKYIVKKNK